MLFKFGDIAIKYLLVVLYTKFKILSEVGIK